MKKVMIALAAVALAVTAQAATVNWQSGTIYIASDAAGTTGSGNTYRANASTRLVTAYLYALTADEYTAAQSMDTATLYSTYSAKSATASKTATAMGIASPSSTVADASGMNYGLILYVVHFSKKHCFALPLSDLLCKFLHKGGSLQDKSKNMQPHLFVKLIIKTRQKNR